MVPDEIVRTLIVIVLFYVVAGFLLTLVRLLLNYRLKSKMITMGVTGPEAEKILQGNTENKDNAVKWSLLLLSAGTGFIIISCFPFGWLSAGILSLCLSIGFGGYYLYLKNKKV
jgi:hypothetical protein